MGTISYGAEQAVKNCVRLAEGEQTVIITDHGAEHSHERRVYRHLFPPGNPAGNEPPPAGGKGGLQPGPGNTQDPPAESPLAKVIALPAPRAAQVRPVRQRSPRNHPGAAMDPGRWNGSGARVPLLRVSCQTRSFG